MFFAGTAAQQLDASFNTSSALEIFEMDFADTSLDMKLRGTLPTSNRSGEDIITIYNLFCSPRLHLLD